MDTPRRLVVGDVHGAYKALLECFENASFDYEKDLLICLGDVCDGWPQIRETIDELLKVKNLIYIFGNHDMWTLEWFKRKKIPGIWKKQGGKATMASYKDDIPEEHIQFLKDAKMYHVLENKMFVHGGFIPDMSIEKQDENEFLWDRTLVNSAMHLKKMNPDLKVTEYDEVYVGHTPTITFNSSIPINACGVWLMDTGAGWPKGVLSMMDIDTKELFQSGPVDKMYPGVKSRHSK